MMARVRGAARWWAKALLQSVIARLPGAEALNFRLGEALSPGRHSAATLQRAIPGYLQGLLKVHRLHPVPGATVFELGTGWSPLVPVILHAAGAVRVITADKTRHLRFELARAAVAACLAEADRIGQTFGVPATEVRRRLDGLAAAPDLEALLRAGGIDYLAPRDARETGLATGSVDIWYSYSVLENIPVPVVEGLVAEGVRILRPDGAWYGLVGCSDPFARGVRGMSKVGYLRFSDRAWALLSHNQLAYSNRLRGVDFVRMAERHGLAVQSVDVLRDEQDVERLRTARVDPRFAGYTPEELAVFRAEILAVPRRTG